MRLNYYQFPETVNETIRANYGCETTSGCNLNTDLDLSEIGYNCEYGSCYACPNICVKDVDDTLSGISVTRAKQLLKQFGGSAWTYHIDRDGGVFESSEIKLTGNNSRFKYNRHL